MELRSRDHDDVGVGVIAFVDLLPDCLEALLFLTPVHFAFLGFFGWFFEAFVSDERMKL